MTDLFKIILILSISGVLSVYSHRKGFIKKLSDMTGQYLSYHLTKIILSILVICLFFYYSSLALHRHYNFFSTQDLANTLNLLWNLVTTGSPIITIDSGNKVLINEFGNHFNPIIWIFIPFFKLWPEAETLIYGQVTLLLLGVIPLYYIARHLKIQSFYTLLIGLTYILYPGLQSAALYDFTQDSFYPFLLLSLFYFAITRKWLFYWLVAILVMTIKENFILHLSAFGLFLIIYDRRTFLKHGLATVFISIIVFITVIKIVIPHFLQDSYFYFSFYKESWERFLQGKLSSFICLNGFNALKYANIFFNVGTFMPAVFTPGILLFVLPIAERLLVSNIFYYSHLAWFHYNLSYLPLGIISILAAKNFLISKFTRVNIVTFGFIYSLIAVVFFNFIYYMPVASYQRWHERFTDYRRNETINLISRIPQDVSVAAYVYSLPHLFKRQHLAQLPVFSDVEYILYLEKDKPWLERSLDKIIISNEFRVFSKNSAGVILKRESIDENMLQ